MEPSGLFRSGSVGGIILTAKLHSVGEGDTDTGRKGWDGVFLDLVWPPGHLWDSIVNL